MENIHDDSLYAIFNQVIKLKFLRAHKLLDTLGLHPGQAHLLAAVGHNKGISQNQLAKLLNVKPATVTGMIKKLERANLIERKVDDEDQRILRVYPTKEGAELGLKLKGYYEEIRDNCFKNFTNEELMLFRRFLMQMKSNLEYINGEKLDKEFPEF